ncbi:MAG: SAM-dependent methyltransferase, partial [Actinocrinis sp.]
MPDEAYMPWSQAMERALYGPDGFYRSRGGPAAHFRTSVHASPLFATAVLRLLRETDEALGCPDEVALVDVGAGRGELLEAVLAQLNDEPDAADRSDPPPSTVPKPLADRLRLIAVERAERPDELTRSLVWRNTIPTGVTGLLIANEWLDNVPCDLVQATPQGWRTVEVAADGAERLGAGPDAGQRAWLSAWWPLPGPDGPSAEDGGGGGGGGGGSNLPPTRAEIGLSRD